MKILVVVGLLFAVCLTLSGIVAIASEERAASVLLLLSAWAVLVPCYLWNLREYRREWRKLVDEADAEIDELRRRMKEDR